MTAATPRHPEGDPPVVVLYVQRGPNGGIRLAAPNLPGWVASARRATDVYRALQAALREAELAAYAHARGYAYDAMPFAVAAEHQHDFLPVLRQVRRQNGAKNWRITHDPAAWVPLPDGRWRSPRGLTYPPDTQVVSRVIRVRKALGLPTRHPDAPATGDSSCPPPT